MDLLPASEVLGLLIAFAQVEFCVYLFWSPSTTFFCLHAAWSLLSAAVFVWGQNIVGVCGSGVCGNDHPTCTAAASALSKDIIVTSCVSEKGQVARSECKAAGLDIKEPDLCETVLAGLPAVCDIIVTVLQNKSEEEQSLDVILPQLVQVEQSDRVPTDTEQIPAERVSRRREYAGSNRRCF